MVDTGRLVACLKQGDQDHAWAEARFRQLCPPLLTCEAVLSEAFFLLQQTYGGADKLLSLLHDTALRDVYHRAAEPQPSGE
jgi:predicted nucleic acid-binding protein